MTNQIDNLPEFAPCHVCGHTFADIRVQPCTPKRIDGEIVFTDVLYLLTCKDEDCVMCNQTLSHRTHNVTTREELLAKYQPEHVESSHCPAV